MLLPLPEEPWATGRYRPAISFARAHPRVRERVVVVDVFWQKGARDVFADLQRKPPPSPDRRSGAPSDPLPSGEASSSCTDGRAAPQGPAAVRRRRVHGHGQDQAGREAGQGARRRSRVGRLDSGTSIALRRSTRGTGRFAVQNAVFSDFGGSASNCSSRADQIEGSSTASGRPRTRV